MPADRPVMLDYRRPAPSRRLRGLTASEWMVAIFVFPACCAAMVLLPTIGFQLILWVLDRYS